MFNRYWFRKYKWHLVFAAVVGVVALIIATPAFSSVPTGNAIPLASELTTPNYSTCELREVDFDMTYRVARINVENQDGYDTILVFVVPVDGQSVTLIATVENGCVLEVS